MKYISTWNILMALCVSTFVLGFDPALAQTERAAQVTASAETDSPESQACDPPQYFTSSGGTNKFAFCVTPHGNITLYEGPAGYFHINAREGYVVCSGESTNHAHGFDSGAAEAGWGAAIASQPGGPKTFPLTIRRQTTDGKFELKQTFGWDTEQKEILITMELKNISAAAISSVILDRYFHGDIDGANQPDIYDTDRHSVWGRDNFWFQADGVMLTALSLTQPHSAWIETYADWNPTGIGGNQTARDCTLASILGPTAPGAYVGRLRFSWGTIPAGATKTVKIIYRRF